MPAEPHRIAGATYNGDRNGISTFRVPWVVYTEEEIATFVPPSPPLGLPLVERFAAEDNGDWILTLVYEGLKDGQEPVELFELDDSTAEQPIDTYPDFGANVRWEKYKWDDTKREFPKSVVIDGKKVSNPLYGTTSYLDINPIWRKSYVLSDFPTDLLATVGCIDTPTGKKTPPKLAGDRDWLKRSLKAVWRGNVWAINEEWMASGRYKWNRDIYKVTDVPGK